MDYKIQDTTLTGIANAIRAKEESSGSIKVSDFASRISAIESGGNGFLATDMNARLPYSQNWKSITYGDGKFVAIAHGESEAAISYDGINWTAMSVVYNEPWQSITYGNGMFVAVAFNSRIITYSTDGITWGNTALFSSKKTLYSVTYGNGKFVAVGSNVCAVSDNGRIWTESTLPFSCDSVAYGNGMFVAASGYRSDMLCYSTDGINWETTTTPVSIGYNPNVVFGAGKFVIVSSYFGFAIYSTNGVDWEVALMPSCSYWSTLAYGDGVFVAVSDYVGEPPAFSYDGINWALTSYEGVNAMSVIYADGKFVAIDNETSDVRISYDGINWYTSYTGLTDAKGKDVTGYVLSKLGRLPYSDINNTVVRFTLDGQSLTAYSGHTWYEWYENGHGYEVQDHIRHCTTTNRLQILCLRPQRRLTS